MSILLSVLKDLFTREKAVASFEADAGQAGTPLVDAAMQKLQAGDLQSADAACTQLRQQFPGDPKAADVQRLVHDAIVHQRFPGPMYLEWLKWFHTTLKPANYVEIGVQSGQSLQFARSPTRAVGIDPDIQIVHSQEAWVKLFKLPSDDFFARHNLRDVLGTDHVDLAFIDGLHTFDQALKDFINIERFATPQTVVLFHDIFPVVPATAERERNTVFWVGDTWKVMLALLQYRPDLKIFTIPTYPSGLAVVTNLDADSTVLQNAYEDIVRDSLPIALDEHLPTLAQRLNPVDNNFAIVARTLAELRQ